MEIKCDGIFLTYYQSTRTKNMRLYVTQANLWHVARYNEELILPAHHLHQTFLEYATTESNPWTTGVTNGKNAIILKELATVYIQHLPEQSTKKLNMEHNSTPVSFIRGAQISVE